MINPYITLQVAEVASPYVIRAAWAALIRECHPDGPKADAKRTRALNEAYAVLKDPAKRKQLDQALKIARVQEAKPGHYGKVRTENVTSAYPPAYLQLTDEDIDSAIDDMSRAYKIPPFLKSVAKLAHRAARGRS